MKYTVVDKNKNTTNLFYLQKKANFLPRFIYRLTIPLLITMVIVLLTIYCSIASTNDNEITSVLDTAETFFKSLNDKSFIKTWQGLTEKSKTTIVEDIYKAVNKGEIVFTIESISDDMKDCKEICKGYWNGFLKTFNPDLVLYQSKWEIASITANTAEVKITYKKAQRPAILKMQKEHGKWKVGLVETFWSRK